MCELTEKKFGDKAGNVVFTCADIIRAEVAILLPREVIQRYDTFALLHVILVPWPPPFPSSPLYFWLPGLDEGPGEDIDPLKEPLGCSNGSNPGICLSVQPDPLLHLSEIRLATVCSRLKHGYCKAAGCAEIV